jgi:hypothetical protein
MGVSGRQGGPDVPLTSEQMVRALAARRMLDDEQFQAVLDAIVANAAGQAMFLDHQDAREQARQLVIAVSRVRNELIAAAELPEAEEAADRHARSME